MLNNTVLSVFIDFDKFRLKPKTVNLNGVDCGMLKASSWESDCPCIVTIEFKNEDDAYHFHRNAINIFNGVK